MTPLFDDLRHFVYQDVFQNPAKYPPGMAPHAVSCLESVPSLTEGFASELLGGEIYSQDDIAPRFPYVQVLVKDIKQRKFRGIDEDEKIVMPVVSLQVRDGGGFELIIKLATQLLPRASDIIPGGVLRLLSFRIIPVLTGAVAILLMIFSVHGQAEIEDDFWKAPAKTIAPTPLVENPVGDSDIVMHVCCADTRLCSLHGIKFRSCIVDKLSPSDLPFSDIVGSCHFVSKEEVCPGVL